MWFQICRYLIYQRQNRLGSFSRYGFGFCFPHLKSHWECGPGLENFYILSRLSFQKHDFHWGQLLHVKTRQGKFFTQIAFHSLIHSFKAYFLSTYHWGQTCVKPEKFYCEQEGQNPVLRILRVQWITLNQSSGLPRLGTVSHSGLYSFLCLWLDPKQMDTKMTHSALYISYVSSVSPLTQHFIFFTLFKRAALVAQWQRIHLPMQETWGFDLWVGKTPWRRKWQPNPVFLPEKPYRQKSLVGYSLLLLLLSHFSHVWLCATPWLAAHQAPPSLGFSRQEHWSGLLFPSPMHESKNWKWSCSVMSDSSWPHGLQPTRLLRPWDFPGKSTGMGCHSLLWGYSLWGCKRVGHDW